MTTRESAHYKGRKFDTWSLKVGDKLFTAEIRIDGTAQGVDGYGFWADIEELGIHVGSKDPNEIPKLLKQEVLARVSTKWELWVRVKIETHPNDDDRRLILSYYPFGIGTNEAGGQLWAKAEWSLKGESGAHRVWSDDAYEPPTLRTFDGDWHIKGAIHIGSPDDVGEDAERLDPKSFDAGKPHRVLVRGTIENVNAILRFDWELRNLAHKIRDHFSDTPHAEATLARIARGAGPLSLPAPNDESTKGT